MTIKMCAPVKVSEIPVIGNEVTKDKTGEVTIVPTLRHAVERGLPNRCWFKFRSVISNVDSDIE